MTLVLSPAATLIPWYYQDEAIDAIFKNLAETKDDGIIALPTGTGKSVVIAEFLRRAYMQYPELKVLSLTHVKELIDQNFKQLLRAWPTAPAGVYSAGLDRRELGRKITFCGIQTVAKLASMFGHINLILIDECHLVSDKGTSLYRKFIAAVKAINPNCRVIGFSATHFRLGMGLLTEGTLFHSVWYDRTSREAFNQLIDEGFLTRLIPKRTKTELDVSGVATTAGEYNQKQLEAAVDRQHITRAALREVMEHGKDRASWLIFAAGIQHAEHIAKMLNDEFGIPATTVHSKVKDRDERIAKFKAGHFRAVVNNNVLTTGFDHPPVDLIVVLRPTQSPVLWVQMLGRGTRCVYASGFNVRDLEQRLAAIAAGPKQNCLVLDFAANSRRLGPINDPKIPKKKGKSKGGGAPYRICEACDGYNHARASVCEFCGAEFPYELRIGTEASTVELIAPSRSDVPEMPKVETFKVDTVTYKKHDAPGKTPSLDVQYFCGLRRFREFVCLQHESRIRAKAQGWWRRAAQTHPPASVDEALTRLNELRAPSEINVWLKDKYPQVMECVYAERE